MDEMNDHGGVREVNCTWAPGKVMNPGKRGLVPPRHLPGISMNLSRESPFTCSCLRAFWACSGFLYSTNPNPMEISTPEKEKGENPPGGRRGSQDELRTKCRASTGPDPCSAFSFLFHTPSLPPKASAPGLLFTVTPRNLPVKLYSHHPSLVAY
jgi:hypothetical protein